MSDQRSFNPARWANAGALIGIVGLVALFAAGPGSVGLKSTWQSYFVGFGFWLVVVLGCLGLQTLHHAVRGSWGLGILRLVEAGGGVMAFAVFGVAFAVMAALGLPSIYEAWAGPGEHELHGLKASMLTPAAYSIRFAIYFAIWIAIAYKFRQSTVKEDETLDANLGKKRSELGAVGLVIYFIVATLMVTDLVMSLDPHWFTTIMGVWVAVCGALGAFSISTMILCYFGKAAPFNRVLNGSLTKDLGNLMFTCTMLWAYFTLSQYLIIWSGNLPEFNRFYVNRGTQFWTLWGAVNVLGSFFVPWFWLLSPRVKAKPSMLFNVALVILVFRFVDWIYNVVPFFHATPQWTDAVALIGFGGLWLFAFGKTASQASLLVRHDQRLEEMTQMEAAHGHA